MITGDLGRQVEGKLGAKASGQLAANVAGTFVAGAYVGDFGVLTISVWGDWEYVLGDPALRFVEAIVLGVSEPPLADVFPVSTSGDEFAEITVTITGLPDPVAVEWASLAVKRPLNTERHIDTLHVDAAVASAGSPVMWLFGRPFIHATVPATASLDEAMFLQPHGGNPNTWVPLIGLSTSLTRGASYPVVLRCGYFDWERQDSLGWDRQESTETRTEYRSTLTPVTVMTYFQEELDWGVEWVAGPTEAIEYPVTIVTITGTEWQRKTVSLPVELRVDGRPVSRQTLSCQLAGHRDQPGVKPYHGYVSAFATMFVFDATADTRASRVEVWAPQGACGLVRADGVRRAALRHVSLEVG